MTKGVHRKPRERALHQVEGQGRLPGEGLGLERLSRAVQATRTAGAQETLTWGGREVELQQFLNQSLPLHNSG